MKNKESLYLFAAILPFMIFGIIMEPVAKYLFIPLIFIGLLHVLVDLFVPPQGPTPFGD